VSAKQALSLKKLQRRMQEKGDISGIGIQERQLWGLLLPG
jgi:hypothetical protein